MCERARKGVKYVIFPCPINLLAQALNQVKVQTDGKLSVVVKDEGPLREDAGEDGEQLLQGLPMNLPSSKQGGEADYVNDGSKYCDQLVLCHL